MAIVVELSGKSGRFLTSQRIARNHLDFFSFSIDYLATERIMKECKINYGENGYNMHPRLTSDK